MVRNQQRDLGAAGKKMELRIYKQHEKAVIRDEG